jgi:putative transposase
VVRKLTEADRLLAQGADTAEVARQLGVSEQTYFRWRNQFGGLKAEDAKRLKELEKENARLKRLLAEAELEKERAWLREYAGKHPRWGHRRAYHGARSEGWTVNHKKIQRLWREEGRDAASRSGRGRRPAD